MCRRQPSGADHQVQKGIAMRLTVLGGGGFRVPTGARRAACGRLPDAGHRSRPARRRPCPAAAYRRSAGGSASSAPDDRPRIHVESDLADAVRGSDFVFSAIRVGGLAGRVCDERAALANGVLGQETTGAGGVCYGLRTIPVALRIAETVRTLARTPTSSTSPIRPAWSPSHVCRARRPRHRYLRLAGRMFKRVGRALGVDPSTPGSTTPG
jgi:6-phospho-beta-glucosidase